MRLDSLVQKRFSELEQQARDLSEEHLAALISKGADAYYIDYSGFKGWATRVLNLLQRAFGENSIHFKQFYEHANLFRGNVSEFETCREIFEAAREDYEGGYLFNVRGLVKAEVLEDAFEQARELLSSGYKDPACVLVGVVLETTLKELCTRHRIALAKLDKMNADLCKAEIYNMAKQKQITAWTELRNKAAHGEWTEYNNDDVRDFLDGVQRFMADYM